MSKRSGRPSKYNGPMNTRINTPVPDGWATEIASITEEEGITAAEFVRYCIELGLATRRVASRAISVHQSIDSHAAS